MSFKAEIERANATYRVYRLTEEARLAYIAKTGEPTRRLKSSFAVQPNEKAKGSKKK